MSIFKTSVNKPITTLMIVAGIIVMGIFSLMNMPVDLLPEMDPPYISVITKYPGASAADIETNITRHLEDAFNTVDNLKDITSVSKDNLSVITLRHVYIYFKSVALYNRDYSCFTCLSVWSTREHLSIFEIFIRDRASERGQ